MKIARLILQAYGPFSGETLNFVGNRANLHLIYGPNEAGKSAALRAMIDLRFGIPHHSADDFLHKAKDLRIAGLFIDAHDNEVALVRRKGRKDTLGRFDIASGPALSTEIAAPDLERALSGGLQRAEFELMFGINHARLREGGKNLLKGEGELGSALFEASAGTQGITALLEQLDGDAKHYFNPHARTQNALINGARAELEAARRELRARQTRPNDWHKLSRDHDEALAKLAEVTAALDVLRRSELELNVLRVVEPSIRRLDLAENALAACAHSPDLPADARERRLAAEQSLGRAERDRQQAETALARCDAALSKLTTDAEVIDHAGAIERLAAAIEQTARSRVDAHSARASIASAEQELRVKLARIAPLVEADEILAAIPSEADKATLVGHLAQVDSLQQRAADLRELLASLDEQLDERASEPTARVDNLARQRIEYALQEAQALGNVRERLNEFDQQINSGSREVRQGLADLGVASIQVLTSARPLLESEIGQARNELKQTRALIDKHLDAQEKLKPDLDEQRLRERRLAATGEVISAGSLRAARERRDLGWHYIRRAYIEHAQDAAQLGTLYDGMHPLPEAFEIAQSESDRHADLLHADAERAARLSEALTRIEQMETALREGATALTQQQARATELQRAWSAKLLLADLPALDIDTLSEWQGQRKRILDAQARLRESTANRDVFLNSVKHALTTLLRTLSDADVHAEQAVAKDVAGELAEQMTRALHLIRTSLERDAAANEREKARQLAIKNHAKRSQELAKTNEEILEHEQALTPWLAKMRLSGALDTGAFRARLAELETIAKAQDSLRGERRNLQSHESLALEFCEKAGVLAGLLQEAAPTDPDDFADRMLRRLQTARALEQGQKDLLREQRQAQAQLSAAQKEQQTQMAKLDELCRMAGVDAAEKLPDSEAASSRKRDLINQVAQIRQQIAEDANSTESELRKRLENLDALAIDTALERCHCEIAMREAAQSIARQAEEQTRHSLAAIDDSDLAAAASEALEAAAARFRAALRPWARLRLGHALLAAALIRYRERAQGPMLAAASEFFAMITGERYARLLTDDSDGTPVLRAERADGRQISIDAMSEGTADQLYLALRLAALELRRGQTGDVPLMLDDALITSDDQRSARVFKALERFARGRQVMLFTHHEHLLEIARKAVGGDSLAIHTL